ncbi:MAG TPA: tetratricopeptide repeat protein, partial [Chthonomonadaceae bacterium]|nr:tetratricopeptide repeat protein [Chthonomonadaceae bacterium]
QHTLIAALAGQRMLLVFDNCHPKLAACHHLADALLRSCPHLKILATSRHGLGIKGEQSYLVPSLSLPEGREVVSPAVVQRSEAARLFLDRAASVAPDFALSTVTSSTLARICHRLDGIPLALELAAVRLDTLSLEQIDNELDAYFRRHFGEKREVAQRKQTLRIAIEWSFDLLGAVEQALLCRLTVFRGGWTQEAAEAVCAGEDIPRERIAEGLMALRDAALLTEADFGSMVRYEMSEAIGDYCRTFLETVENIAVQRNHAVYYLGLAQAANANLDAPEAAAWLDYMEREQQNFRVALTWCHNDAACGEIGTALAEALQTFWENRVFPGERQALLSRLGAVFSHDDGERGDALMAAGEQALREGDYALALARYEQALALHRRNGDRKREAQTLHHLGIVARETGYHMEAQERHEQALALHRELNDPVGEALHLHNLAGALKERGDYEGARRHYEQAYSRNWGAGNRTAAAHNLNGLARVAVAQGDRETAHRLFTEALGIFQEAHDTPWQAYNLREIVKLDLQPGLFWVENHK